MKFKMGSLEQGKRMEEDYTRGIGILRSEFGRLRGSAEAFANAQAAELIALNTEVKKLHEEMEVVQFQLDQLKTTVIAAFATPKPRPVPTPRPTSITHPRQPAPHLRPQDSEP